MADDKKKEDQKDDGKKKKGLPPIVMIAVGAIVGGAGVVFAVPPKTVEVKVEEPHFEDVLVTHPDLVRTEFNPRMRAGKGMARLSFKFVYRVREDLEAQAFKQIEARWDEVNSRALLLFKTRSNEELNSEAGVVLLEHDLVEELDDTLFPEGDEKIARVTNVMWKDFILQ